jgi:multidrug efflux system membrane fusion protein
LSQEGRTRTTATNRRGAAVFDFLKRYPKVLLPVLVLTIGLLIGGGMIMARPSVATRPPSKPIPMVLTLTAEPESVHLKIRSQGTVAPRTESDLIAEVSGRITWVSASLASGGFIEKDAPLIEIDARDYEVSMTRAKAVLSRTESQLALAKRAAERQRVLSKRGVTSPVSLDDAENALLVMEANKLEAEASLTQARHDLQRTKVTAPFAGRIRTKHVDVGQFVNRGNPVARLYAVDYAEVRLPIPDDATAFVDLPIDYRGEEGEAPQPEVVLSADYGGKRFSWKGRIVRTEGELDPRTRMIHAVARVEDPYGRGDDPTRPPFAVGLFVEAEIEGRLVDDIYTLPRAALRGNNRVVVVDGESRARLRPITLLQQLPDRVLVASGLEPGDRVVTSPLALTIDGMPVEVEPERARATTP